MFTISEGYTKYYSNHYSVMVFDPHLEDHCEVFGISPKKAVAKANRIIDLLNQHGQ